MTAKAAICKALIFGKTLNIGTGFKLFGVTNIPREIGRSVERSFGVKCDRTPRAGETRYKVACNWTDYKLKVTEENREGIRKMIEYILKAEGEALTQEQASDQKLLKHLLTFVT